jgi:hypothetical protein
MAVLLASQMVVPRARLLDSLSESELAESWAV